MNFFFVFALLCSISLTDARVLSQDSNGLAPNEAYYHSQTNVSIVSDVRHHVPYFLQIIDCYELVWMIVYSCSYHFLFSP